MFVDEIKVRIKTKERLRDLCTAGGTMPYCMPDEYKGLSGNGNNIADKMLKYCDKVITLDNWNGWRGFYKYWIWTLPMIESFPDVMNRNGANS